VAQIARTISKVLKLNEDLTEAIALGHDLGHPPFGHAGEQILNELCPEGFAHNEQSIRIVEFLEKEGEGLNLTEEVRDGIRHHSKGELGSLCRGKEALSLEAEVVRLSDCIAYINHDIQDALDAGVIKVEQLPSDCVKILGERYSQRIDMMVKDTILNSMGKEQVCMSPKVLEATEKLRSYLYEQVYTHPRIKKEAEKAKRVLEALYTLFTKNPSLLWSKMPFLEGKVCVHKAACDFLSLMGDREALTLYQNLFLPKPWSEGE
jgi:dGTPase